MEFDFLWDLLMWSKERLKEAYKDKNWEEVYGVIERIREETGVE